MTAGEHEGCRPGQCREGERWRTVSCAGLPVLSIPLMGGEGVDFGVSRDSVWVIPGPGPIAAELHRLDTIGKSLRHEISDEDWEWFSAHPLSSVPGISWGEVIPVLLGWMRQRGGEGDAPTGSVLGGLDAHLDDPREHSGAEQGDAQVEANGVQQSHSREGGQDADDQEAESGEHERRGGDLHAGKGTDTQPPSAREWLTEAERLVLRYVDSTLREADRLPPQAGTLRIAAGGWTTVEGYVERILAARAQRPEEVATTDESACPNDCGDHCGNPAWTRADQDARTDRLRPLADHLRIGHDVLPENRRYQDTWLHIALLAEEWFATQRPEGVTVTEAARGVLRTASRPTHDSATAQVNAAALDRLRAALAAEVSGGTEAGEDR